MHRVSKHTFGFVFTAHVCSCTLACSASNARSDAHRTGAGGIGSEVDVSGGAAGRRASDGGAVAEPDAGAANVDAAAGGTNAIDRAAAGSLAMAGRQLPPTTDATPAGAGTFANAGSSGTIASAGSAGADATARAGQGQVELCDTPPPPPSQLVGWAATPSDGTLTTTGGGDAPPTRVTNFAALSAAAGGTKAAVIYLQGNIAGSLSVGSNKTIVGVCGGTITGHVRLSSSSNVILRNLKIVGYDCKDSPSDCSGGVDAVTIINGAHHVWVDHCAISDGSDANLDVTNGSDRVTVSYTKFSYSSRRAGGHLFSNTVGAADDVAADAGRLNVTFHHDLWADNIEQGMPRTRRGKIHLFNNLFTSSGNSYCTSAGFEAAVLVENSLYIGVNRPLLPESNSIGLESRGNLFIDTTGNTEGLRSSFAPPYAYTMDDPAKDFRAQLEASVGPK